ncbi:TM2 domain-containing protein [Candidatus Ornithobacterium hominis]|uniref:hypothetical protein n=1 Tax=Candidatus Ornithobacterium hominis TaxID=2497989 RepID=UPI0024BD0843|nr:hypothetical protein [Candidatus Ornithobacterium hominis]CAI9428736.1 TM2 domain-containing protein [Candidatus Ornithobacterium hominis]
MENQNTQYQENRHDKQTVIIKERKSIGLSLLLTILFGPLGMLYTTVSGAIIMFVVSLIVAIITFGFGVLFICWPICMIWGVLAAKNYNSKINY